MCATPITGFQHSFFGDTLGRPPRFWQRCAATVLGPVNRTLREPRRPGSGLPSMRLAALYRSGPRARHSARSRMADGRTALSQHRRRPQARRPRRRRVGVFMVTAAAATVAVTAIALLVITGRPGSVTDPLGAAVAQVSAGKSGLALAQERQKVIMQTAATEAFSLTSTPKISTAPPPVATTVTGTSTGTGTIRY